jgi:hypothetical protein
MKSIGLILYQVNNWAVNMSNQSKIPFCQSEFLQDFTIVLGVQLDAQNMDGSRLVLKWIPANMKVKNWKDLQFGQLVAISRD